jgi:hypothetical protein
MKAILTAFACAWMAFPAIGAVGVTPTTPQPSNVRFVTSGMPFQTITNSAVAAPSGTLHVFYPGRYWIPTNTLGWGRGGTYYWHLWPGATLVFGSSNDVTAGAVFGDGGFATTNIVSGYGDIVISNKNLRLVHLQAASTFIATVNSIYNPNTNTGSSGLIEIAAAGTTLNIHAYDFIDWRPYDLLLAGDLAFQAGPTVVSAGRRLSAGNSLIEFGRAPLVLGSVILKAPYMETTFPNGDMVLTPGVVVEADTINFGDRGFIWADNILADPGYAIINVRRITANSTSTRPLISNINGSTDGLRFVNTTFEGGTAVDVMNISAPTTPVMFENCRITGGATNSITAASAETIKSLGLSIEKPLSSTVRVDGPVTGLPSTNTYSGTNVVLNVAGADRQVLIATNAMLLIVTNAGIFSGKNGTLTIYNNGATNDNIAWTTANVRFAGPDGSNTVVAAKSLIVDWKNEGTNTLIRTYTQKN